MGTAYIQDPESQESRIANLPRQHKHSICFRSFVSAYSRIFGNPSHEAIRNTGECSSSRYTISVGTRNLCPKCLNGMLTRDKRARWMRNIPFSRSLCCRNCSSRFLRILNVFLVWL